MRRRLPVATFALAVKEELAGQPADGAAGRAELHGLIRACGSLVLTPGAAARTVACELRCERAVVARRAHRLLVAHAGRRPTLAVRRGPSRAGGRFLCRLPAAADVLAAIGLCDRAGRPRPSLPARLLRPPLAAALLRGVFLGAGSIDDPARDHHLELELDEGAGEVAAGLEQALAACGCPSHRRQRRGRIVLYLKDAGAISELLAHLGAPAGLLAYEEQRIRREVRGAVNRIVNAETANLGKAAMAGAVQRDEIATLVAAGGLEGLPPALRETALLRLGHPEASLRELGDLFVPPLSKSAVQRRIAALRRLAAGGRARGTGS